jgi:hypothetical protein
MIEINSRIEGLDEVLRKTNPVFLLKPIRAFFTRATARVELRAKANAPHDTGRNVRGNIESEVDRANPALWGKVVVRGSKLGSARGTIARAMEYGTGTQNDGPFRTGKRHWPPAQALDAWARKHGFVGKGNFGAGRIVAFLIGRRGGLRPIRYMRNAWADSQNDIQQLFKILLDDIRREW